MDHQMPLPGLAGIPVGSHTGPNRLTRCTKACDQCHKHHRHCNTQQPCNECERRGIVCTYSKIPRRRGPKPRTLDKIAERVLALVARSNPNLEAQIIQEALNGKDPVTGHDNIEALQSTREKDHLLALFDRSAVANVLLHYEAGRYTGNVPSRGGARLIPTPLRRGIDMWANSPLCPQDGRGAGDEQAASGSATLQMPGTNFLSPAIPHNSLAAPVSVPGPSRPNPVALQNRTPLPTQAQTTASPYQLHGHQNVAFQPAVQSTSSQGDEQMPDDNIFADFQLFTNEDYNN